MAEGGDIVVDLLCVIQWNTGLLIQLEQTFCLLSFGFCMREPSINDDAGIINKPFRTVLKLPPGKLLPGGNSCIL